MYNGLFIIITEYQRTLLMSLIVSWLVGQIFKNLNNHSKQVWSEVRNNETAYWRKSLLYTIFYNKTLSLSVQDETKNMTVPELMTSACSLSNSFAAIFITPISTIIITITAEIYANTAWVRAAKLPLTACWYLHLCNINSFTNYYILFI